MRDLAAVSPMMSLHLSLPVSVFIFAASLLTLPAPTFLGPTHPSLISLSQWLGPKGVGVGGLGEAKAQDVLGDVWEGGREAL